MASHGKHKKVVSEVSAPASLAEYKPQLYLDLEGQDVSQVLGLKVGEEVMVHVTGKIVGLEQRERKDNDTEGKTKTTGTIRLEGYRVQVMGDEDSNEYEEMAEEDE